MFAARRRSSLVCFRPGSRSLAASQLGEPVAVPGTLHSVPRRL